MRYRKRKKAARQTLAMSILVVGALSVLIVLACSQVFIVRDVMVVGNRNLLREEVVTQSGVQIGDNLLSLSDQSLRQALEQNRYIQYQGHEFDYRGTLTLHIRERLGMAVVYDLGYYYVLDGEGMVLDCAGSAYPTGVAGPKVTGFNLSPNSRITVGEKLPVLDKGQLEAMETVLAELENTNLLSRTSELSVKNTDNIYILTAEGAKIELGDTGSLKTKLMIGREVLSVREEQGDLLGAKIDVSNGKNAHYIPAVLPTITPTPTTTPTPSPTPADTP
ncbi:MAG: cell division protein FtsQ/DivIB [Candidatus Ventricola sp.]